MGFGADSHMYRAPRGDGNVSSMERQHDRRVSVEDRYPIKIRRRLPGQHTNVSLDGLSRPGVNGYPLTGGEPGQIGTRCYLIAAPHRGQQHDQKPHSH